MPKQIEKAANKLDFYKNRDATHPSNLLYEPPNEDFYGPTDERTCTDWAAIIVFGLFFVFAFFYAYFAYQQYYPVRIFHGLDFRADYCGRYQLSNKPFQYLLDPDNWKGISICVEQCPQAPDYTQQICLYHNDGQSILEDYCYETYYTDPYKQYCMPMELGPRRRSIEKIIFTDLTLALRIGGDFYISIEIIIGAFGMQIALAIIYIIVLLGKRIAHVMLWAFITGFCVAFAFITGYITYDADKVVAKECPPERPDDVYDCARNQLVFLDTLWHILIVVIPLYAIIMIASFHKILRMIQVMDNMIKPLRQLPWMLIVPLFVSLLQAAIACLYLLVYIGGVTSGSPQTLTAPQGFPSPQYRSVEFQVWQQRGFYVVTFVYFWLLQALYYYVRFFISCSSAVWYYSRDKNYLNAPIMRAMWFGLRYHIGSFFWGALLLGPSWMLSGFFYFWKIGLSSLSRKGMLLGVLLLVSTPLFVFYEYVGKYCSNRNYLHMSIFGDNFWESGKKTFYLRVRNNSRVEMMRSILGFVRVVGMCFMSSLGAYMVYYQLYTRQLSPTVVVEVKEEVEYPIVPAIFVFVTGLYLTQNFTSVIDIIAETMIFALIADEEMFMGKQRFADQDMLGFVNKYSKEKSKDEFDVTNKGKVNPVNDNADADDLIKPINPNDLYGADDGDKDKDKNKGDHDSDGDGDGSGSGGSDDEDSDDYKNRFNNQKFGLDDLGNLEGNEEDVEYEDELAEYNRKKVKDQGKLAKLKEDAIQLDANQKKKEDKTKRKGQQF